ncbi:hypothetical protein M9H77_11197 [Catharanthus roseus]|uniref:Uncharacterized protein n=1 Tax=Catharanthus roseus TaxID=4058 RepID=A0ACC0BDY5_CATRO|nr:hypothetical protein M9H77_11197 [Catharanthus roseus]
MRQVKAAVSSVCTAFYDHMRRLVECSHLPYTLMPPIMDIVIAAITVVPSISSSTGVAEGTSDTKVSSSTPPPLSIDAPDTSTVDPLPLPPPPPPPPPSLIVMLGIPRMFDILYILYWRWLLTCYGKIKFYR